MGDRVDRSPLLREHDDAMRDFNAFAVLLQEAIAGAIGINAADLQVLGVLMSDGPTSPGVLATRVGLSSGGAITALVDRLERAGFVRRGRDVADRRRVLVVADSERVLATVGSLYGAIAERWHTTLADFSDAEVEAASRVLRAATEANRSEIARLRHDSP